MDTPDGPRSSQAIVEPPIAAFCWFPGSEGATSPGAAYFIDPPYSAGGKRAGKRLYAHNQLDHERLFKLAGALAGHFLMTYDDAPEVRDMARRHGFEVRTVPMKNTHHEKMRELLVSRDLTWLG